jgi:hypothetical protein
MKRILAILLAALTVASAETPLTAPPPGPPPDLDLPAALARLEKPTIISAETALREAMMAFQWSGPDSIWDCPEDSRYIKPTRTDFTDFLRYFRAKKAKEKYASQSWDCDDTAREGLHLGRLWGHQNYRGIQAALMIGAALVEVRNKDPKKVAYHVLDFVGFADGTWSFFEPQEGKLVTLEQGLKEYRILKLQF